LHSIYAQYSKLQPNDFLGDAMSYELYEFHKPWLQGQASLLEAMLSTISLGGLAEFSKVPVEMELLDSLPELLGRGPSEDAAAALAVAKLLDKVATDIKRKGIWLSRDRRWGVRRVKSQYRD
jgi:hypothetical protein